VRTEAATFTPERVVPVGDPAPAAARNVTEAEAPPAAPVAADVTAIETSSAAIDALPDLPPKVQPAVAAPQPTPAPISVAAPERATMPESPAAVQAKKVDAPVPQPDRSPPADEGPAMAAIHPKPIVDEAPSKRRSSSKDRRDDAPRSVRPAPIAAAAPRATLGSDTDELSISGQFFRKEEDSVTPHAVDTHELLDDEDGRAIITVSPETLARRGRFRRAVAGVVAFAGVLSIAVVGRTLLSSRATGAVPAAPAHVAASEALRAPEPVKVAEATRVPVEPVAASDARVAAVDEPAKAVEPAQPEAKPEEKPAEAAKPEEPAKAAEPAKPAADAAALRKEAFALLNRGKMKDSIPVSQAAIAADPTDALPYLYLGSALQETGKWKAGIEAYSECVRNAKKGPIHECRAMGGHK
jgi:hypothetical protein